MVVAVAVTIISNAISRAAAVLAQVIVGLYLTESEVGAFAIALGINGFCCVMRSGGLSYCLPTLRADEYDRAAGRYLAWGLTFASFGGILTAVSAGVAPKLPWLQAAADAPGLAPSLLLLAVRQFLVPLGLLARSRMAVNLRFGELAKLDSAIAILRLALTWVCAHEGLGTLAMVIPIVATSVAETIYCLCVAGLTRESFRARGSTLRAMAHHMSWPIAVASLTSIGVECHYLIIGTMIPIATVGVFYFALQLAMQPVMMVGLAFQRVFAPLLSRIRGDREAESHLVSRVFMGAMLLVPVTTLSIGGLFPYVERMVWDGRWAEAAIPVAWLSVGATFSTATSVLVGPLMGARHFKALAGIELSRTLGVFGGAMAGALLAAALPPQGSVFLQPAAIVAAMTSVGITMTSVIQLGRIMRHYGLPWGDIAHHLVYGPTLSVLTVVGAVSVADSAANSFTLPAGRTGAAIELAIATCVFSGITILAFRTLAESTVRAVAQLLPAPWQGLFRKVLLLGPSDDEA